MTVEGLKITATCDTCSVREYGWLVPRMGSDAMDLAGVFCAGWKAQHAGHEQLVIASPDTVEADA